MNADLNQVGNATLIKVQLSKRNLETLLHKIDEPDSERTITRRLNNGNMLIVSSEDNDTHYKDRPAGAMHPREEERISRPETGITMSGYGIPDNLTPTEKIAREPGTWADSRGEG